MQTNILDALALGWVGSIIGLIGIFAAVLTYYLTRQRTILAFSYSGERLLGLTDAGLPSDIKISYRNQDIPRLTRTLFVFWNEGEKTISHDDIVKNDLLRLNFQEDTHTVLKCSRDVTHIQTYFGKRIQNEVILNFDFLDSGDGAVIEILHTGENIDMEFLGTVRGLPKGMRNLGKIMRVKKNNTSKLLGVAKSPQRLAWIIIALGALIASISFFMTSVPLEIFNKLSERALMDTTMFFWVVGALYSLPGVFLLFLARRKYPKSLHIDDLE